jgi:FtsP/CotA-like multicopper oxidase with cupredoxin domain
MRLPTNWRRVAAAATAIMLILVAAMRLPVSAQPAGESGIVCTAGTLAGGTRSFTLYTNRGYVSIPDGNTIFMWSYALGASGGVFQLPGPTLCANQGETVSVRLVNTLSEPSSIVFPGQQGATANGSSVQPQFDTSGRLTSLVQAASAGGGSMTYRFVASQAGTYIYESGTNPVKQIQMGLYGALVIRPAGHPEWAYDASTRFNPDTEYVMLLSEVDPDLHSAVERAKPYDPTAYHPRYWMINGRSFPDTIAPNGAPWLPSQPYGAFVHIQPYDAVTNPYPALVRYLNVGSLNHPFHPHGNHGRVIARDGRLLAGPAGEDLSYEKFLVLVGAGQTWDATYDWTDVEMWNPSTNPIPVTVPQLQNLTFKDGATWYSGSPYLGYQDELPAGTTSFNECGEYYQVWHSHALQEAANFDAGFGGMLTLQRIDPPGGCP